MKSQRSHIERDKLLKDSLKLKLIKLLIKMKKLITICKEYIFVCMYKNCASVAKSVKPTNITLKYRIDGVNKLINY